MDKPNPLSRAEILACSDRERKKREELIAAISANPNSPALKQELDELEQRGEYRFGRTDFARHVIVAWSMLLIAYAVVFALLSRLMETAYFKVLLFETLPLSLVIALGFCIVVLLSLAANTLFLFFWFKRLAILLERERRFAEAVLFSSLNPSVFGSMYAKMRTRYIQ